MIDPSVRTHHGIAQAGDGPDALCHHDEMSSTADAGEFRGGTLRSAWVPFLRLVFALCALSCLGMALDGTIGDALQIVLLAGTLVFAFLVIRSFRITVHPSGVVRRVGWRRTEELGRLSERPIVIRSSFYRYAWAPLVRLPNGEEQILMGFAGYSGSAADCSPRVLAACRMLNGLPRL